MSYPVRVVVKDSVKEIVKTGDRLDLCLCDDPVLRKPGAQEILKTKLTEAGWEPTQENSEVFRKTLDNGTQILWDVPGQQLTLIAETENVIEKEVEMVLRGDSMTRGGRDAQEDDLRKRGQDEVRKQLEKETAKAREEEEGKLLRTVQERLEESVDSARSAVNEVLEGVYRDWLLEQANSLGNVVGKHEAVSENGEVYELTIKIEQ